MGVLTAGQVVVIPFPYSDLTGQKLRPVLLLVPAGYDDWVICQITSNPFSDPLAIQMTNASFLSGGLPHTSYARPSKLFTAHSSLVVSSAGILRDDFYEEIRKAVVAVFC